MKKILWSLGTIVVLLVAAVLVGPGLINWNDYKDDISGQVRDLTGRELTIAGDIQLTVLPSPALVVNEVSFANAKGASAPLMAQFKTVEVRVALAPLFRGQVKVETIKLVEPLIILEKLADGKGNWVIETPSARRGKDASAASVDAPKTAPSTVTGGNGLPAITLENFTIEKGTVVYRDPKAGVEETIDNLNARVAAASLSGPFESNGEMTAGGFALSYGVNVGEILNGRTVPLNLRVGLVGGKAEMTASGTVLNLDEAPRFKGKIKVDGENLSTLLSALQSGAALPRQLARKFSLEGAVVASAAGAEVKELSVRLGETRASGDITVETGNVLRVASRLGIGQIDLDKWLKAGPPVPAAGDNAASSKAVAKPAAVEIPTSRASPEATTKFTLPANVAGSLIFSVDAISYRGGVIRDVVLNGDLTEGLATISQLSAQFPGGSDLAVFGSVAAVDGVPQFDGEIETTVNDLRGVVDWLGVDIPDIPADRLRKLNLTTKIFAKPSQVQIAGLDLRLDNSRLTGGITVAVRDRPSFGANIVVDRLNIDSYLPRPAKPGKAKSAVSKSAKVGKSDGKKIAALSAANPLNGLAILDTFDANVKAHLKTLVHKGVQIKDLVIDGTLYNGSLDLRRFSVAKLAGATVKIKGNVAKLAGLPEAKGLIFDINVPDLSRIARLIGLNLPVDGKKLGAVSATSRLDGNLLKPKIKTTLNVAGATVTADGTGSLLPVGDTINAKVRARHGDLVGLLRRLGVAYRPSGKVGGFDFTTQISGTPSRLRATNLKGKLGKTAVSGAIAIDLTSAKPKVSADLTTGAVIIDTYLPAKRRAGLQPVLQPAAWTPKKSDRRPGGGVIRAATFSRWPTDTIDLSVLQSFDADIALKAPLVAFDKYIVEKFDVAAQIANGALKTKTFKGTVFGGTLDGTVQVAGGARNQIQTALKVSHVDVARALRTVTGEAMADGRMSFDVDIIGSGASVHDIVASLGGRGAFDLTDVDAKKAGKGSALAGLFGLLTSLNSIGGSAKNDKARVTGTFTMARGIAKSRDVKLASAYGNGGAVGSVDLPGWAIDVKGEVRLAESFLMQVLKAKVKESRNAVPFEIKGPLDAPNIKVDTGAALGAGVPIPGADVLLNKAPKGVRSILQGILGGGKKQQPPASEPPPVGNQPPPVGNQPPPVSSQPQQQKTPSLQEQLLKGLFKL